MEVLVSNSIFSLKKREHGEFFLILEESCRLLYRGSHA